ncbi:unnamed protein product [Moneuplotes crassus]|uniref:Uncharacterized protein n=2 Tax=Euplotes crassus TaxID=5936 RepID=A0AAD1XF88_EUPCR|nr:unnamed protein product [Moneuplotes crassus]
MATMKFQPIPLQDTAFCVEENDPEEQRIQRLREMKERESRGVGIGKGEKRAEEGKKVYGRQGVVYYGKSKNINVKKKFKVDGNKLPQRLQGVKFSISESRTADIDTKESFYKSNSSQYSLKGNKSKVSVKSLKDNISEMGSSQENFQRKAMPRMFEHQIEFQTGSHPNHSLIPKKGVTLRTGNGTGERSYSPPLGMTNTFSIGPGGVKRMSRAQYAATIAKEGLRFKDRLKSANNYSKYRNARISGAPQQDYGNHLKVPLAKVYMNSNTKSVKYHQAKTGQRNSGRNITRSRTMNGRVRQKRIIHKLGEAVNSNQVIVHNKYDVSKLLLAETPVKPSSKLQQPSQYSHTFSREKISRRASQKANTKVISHKALF